jgi:hypothetical protein
LVARSVNRNIFSILVEVAVRIAIIGTVFATISALRGVVKRVQAVVDLRLTRRCPRIVRLR